MLAAELKAMLEAGQRLRSLQPVGYSLDVGDAQTATSAEVPFYVSGDRDDALWKHGSDIPMLYHRALTGLNSCLTASITQVLA